MATAEHEGVWLGLGEPERAAPCILSVMDEPVRVRARALRPVLRVLCPRCWLDTRAPVGHSAAAAVLSLCG